MQFDALIDFIENKMRLSHIYQPLLIKCLVDAGGSATIRQLAHHFLAQDESQIQYYEKTIKRMPILKNHSVVDKDKDLVTLNVNVRKLTFEQKAQIKMICERKIQEYILNRGLGLWDYRLLDTNPVPDSLYYNVMKDADGRCALCGATKNERPLHVDHIKPRSKGGKTKYENLQVLCSKCNQAKSNRDDTDFRDNTLYDSVTDCKFCYENLKPRIVEEYNSIVVVKDKYPVSEGHVLIVPKRHTPDYFTMTNGETADCRDILKILQKRISSTDPTVTGFNVGVNCGESAGQTIFHAHMHLIPRRDGDTPNPRGGVRGAIPDKMDYKD
jgi:ATP adenylyltransferase